MAHPPRPTQMTRETLVRATIDTIIAETWYDVTEKFQSNDPGVSRASGVGISGAHVFFLIEYDGLVVLLHNEKAVTRDRSLLEDLLSTVHKPTDP